MALKRKAIIGYLSALAVVAAAGVAGGIHSKAAPQTWASLAETGWYESTYNTFKINSPEDLAGVAELVNEGIDDGLEDKILEITKSLDLSGLEWVPIGTGEHPFRGTLITENGAILEISGMNVVQNLSYQGLVGNMEGGTVGGLTFNSGSISVTSVTYDAYAGAAVGKMSGSSIVFDITNNISVSSDSAPYHAYTGGIVGMGEGMISNSFNNGAVTTSGSADAGGIAGYTDSRGMIIKKVGNTGSIQASNGDQVTAGGIVGRNAGTLSMNDEDTPISNSGPVTVNNAATATAGGIIGEIDASVVFSNATSNSGAVTIEAPAAGRSAAGALAGAVGLSTVPDVAITFTNTAPVINNGGTNVYTGGIAGYTQSRFTWVSSYANTVPVTASGTQNIYTGGFVGYAAAGLVLPDAAAAYEQQAGITVNGGSEVYTGGIAGYDAGGSLNQSFFKGSLNVAGAAGVYTGGIAGYELGGTIAAASAGNTEAAPASIVSDGTIGGIAGYLEGTLSNAKVQDLTLQATSENGVIGGIAGSAQGSVSGVTSGNADSEGYATVVFKADGINNVTYGGLIGLNEKPLTLTDGLTTRAAFVTEAGRSGYTIGGTAGKLTADASVGTAEAPVEVQHIEVGLNADDTSFGGAVGNNATVQIHAHTDELNIQAAGASVRAGGVFGENSAAVPHSLAENIAIAADGADNKLGGYAGVNTGTLEDAAVTRLTIAAGGTGTAAGGIAGTSEGTDTRAVITSPELNVVSDETLITVTGADSKAGAVAGYAVNTNITAPEVNAVTPLQAIIDIQAAGVQAGGLAGALKNAEVTGDATTVNLENLYLMVSPAGEDVFAGGLVGYNEESRLERVVGTGINLVLNGPRATSGGIAGYNRGTSSAVITGTYITGLSLKANAGAVSSFIGGIAGINDAQAADPVPNPATAVSTMQNTRTLGTVSAASASSTVGGMVGENRSLIANNSITDKIPVISKGANVVMGGLAGRNTTSGTLYYTYSNANLTIEGAGTLAGGLVGENNGAVKGSYVDIDVTGKATGTAGQPVYLGGLIGRNSGGNIELSYSASNVKADGVYTIVGGLVGEHASGNIKNSYVAKSVSAAKTGSYAGGFIGRITAGKVSNVYSAAEVNAASGSYAGGFAGRYDSSSKDLLYKSYYIKDSSLNINKDLPDFAEGNYRWLNVQVRLSTILSETLKDRNEFPALSGWDFTGAWKYGSLNATYRYPEVNRAANTGGDSGNQVNANINWYMKDQDAITFQITTEAELAGLASIVNGTIAGVDRFDFAGRTIVVQNPIHIQSKQWAPIGSSEEHPFQGIFDGANQLIDGLTVQPAYSYSGLFGVIGEQATVQNINLEPVNVSGSAFTGALAGLSLGQVNDAHLKLLNGAKISGGTVGGFIGKNTGSMTGLKLTLNGGGIETVVNAGIAGGIVGDNTGAVVSSTYSIEAIDGSIGSAAEDAVVGGAVGVQSGDVTGLEVTLGAGYRIAATGAENTVGGIIGRFTSGKASVLSLTFTDGTVEARGLDSTLGGIVGRAEAGTVLSGIEITAPGTGVQLTGNGTVGGAAGIKEGTLGGIMLLAADSGPSSFDIDQVSAAGLNLTSTGDSLNAVVGGLVGKASLAALNAVSYEGAIAAPGETAVAGGIAGAAANSILYDVNALPELQAVAGTGDVVVGGIAGSLSSDHMNQGFDFGKTYPLYNGIYLAHVNGGSIEAAGTDNRMDVYAGGLVGKNTAASIYRSDSAADVHASGGSTVNAGGIAGYSSGIIVDSSAESNLSAGAAAVYNVGGLVGWAQGGQIHHSKSTASGGQSITVGSALTLEDLLPVTHAGGVVGMGDYATITYTRSDIPVKVTDTNQDNTIYAGGFAGLLGENDTRKGSISVSYATGSVTVSGKMGSYAGGFAGSVDNFNISDAYSSGNVANTALDLRTGGFAGSIDRNTEISGSYGLSPVVSATGIKSATRSYAGGFAGYNDGVLQGIYTNVAGIANNAPGADRYTGALVGYNFRDGKILDSEFTGSIEAVEHNVNGTVEAEQVAAAKNPADSGLWNLEYDTTFLDSAFDGIITVNTAQQLRGAAFFYNETGLAYFNLYDRTAAAKPEITSMVLGGDIDLAGQSWVPFTDLTGKLDGNGHTIRGLRLNPQQAQNVGFVAENHGEIANLNFADAVIAGGTNAAVVAGINHSGAMISGVKLSVSVEAGNAAVLGGAAAVNDGTLTGIEAAELDFAASLNLGKAGGIAGVNNGSIALSKAAGSISAVQAAGGIAGENNGTVDQSVFGGSIDGQWAGGIAGINTDTVTASRYTGGTVNGKLAAGGIAGSNAKSVAGSQATGTVTSTEGAAGGIAGENNGLIDQSGFGGTVNGLTAGGIAGTNGDTISGSAYTNGTVNGTQAAGGIAGINSQTVSGSEATGSVTSAAGMAGGIAGENSGAIEHAEYNGNVNGATAGGIAGENSNTIEHSGFSGIAEGQTAGGIAGINTGKLSTVSSAGTIKGAIAAGGIAGDNRSEIAEALSYAEVTAAAAAANAGGIAGVNTGSIADSYNAGRVTAEGTGLAQAGGIAGHAKEGTITAALNTGEVKAGINGVIAPGQAFFGGIAGTKADQAEIKDSIYNAQMLKNKTAYFNASGKAVSGNAGEAAGMSAAELTAGSVPQALNNGQWTAAASFYPGLVAFKDTEPGLLSTAAVILNANDLINRVDNSFGLSVSPGLSWSASANEAAVGNGTGKIHNGAGAKLTVKYGEASRVITVNEPAFKYPETAKAPEIEQLLGTMILKNPVTLTTTEPGGTIYYTLDGSVPTEMSPMYTAPLELVGQTTVKAITIVEGKEYSNVVTGYWTPQGSTGGGGGFVAPPQSEPAITAVAGTVTQIGDSEAPLKVARGSKLKLTAPEGQIIYYTTDGSTPTDKSPAYTGELLITRSMTIKMITSEDDTVITIQYEVENAKYNLKENSAEIKYMTAYPNSLFKPNVTITRFETIHALAPLLDMEEVNLGNLFNDVPAEQEALTAFFASAGIVEGYPDGGFGGEKGLTRAEFSKIVAVMLHLDTQTLGVTKQNDLKGHWSEAYVNALTAAGYIQGFPDGTFKPNAPITRAQAVVLINRIAGTKKLPAAAVRFTDVPASHWAFKDIMSAVQ
ncbi:chitobiase/beta-hexosaminidase C-terminal domain-containing protein [Paenibacillus tengchongensis]|uniref:chitobiase/beta-hexosaminidase C-terminal domain-containing protein n=1 Tax=Paenibacillus tengchongensis TaxID=2608684 RepID=UPI00124C4555|nr:chitobiase/beta-hexosaminidase C-terminal domain-containing protein [Paenibacillus tengchongensis]